MKLYLIVGHSRSGKDTISDYISKKLKNCKIIPLALSLKDFFCKENDISLEELEKNKSFYRSKLIKTGTNLRTVFSDTIFCEYTENKIRESNTKEKKENFIISDVRSFMEFSYFSCAFAFTCVSIKIKSLRSETEEKNEDVRRNEKDIDTMMCDYEIENNGSIEELYSKVDKILEEVEFIFKMSQID